MNTNFNIAPSLGSERVHALANCTALRAAVLMGVGVLFMTIMAQLTLYLPFTPVPITGETLGVFAIGSLYGKRLAGFTLILYILLGSCGAPIFAGAKSGLILFSASGGYLVGFLLAAMLCGYSVERGWWNHFGQRMLVLCLAEGVIYACGLFQLQFFVKSHLLEAGLLPFLVGDALKVVLLCSGCSMLNKIRQQFKL